MGRPARSAVASGIIGQSGGKATLQNAKRLDQNGYADKSLGIDLSRKQCLPFFNSRMHAMQKKYYLCNETLTLHKIGRG